MTDLSSLTHAPLPRRGGSSTTVSMTVLITGAAGFIGFHVAKRLLCEGKAVVGVDNFSSYYDPALKEARWALLKESDTFEGVRLDITERDQLSALFADCHPAKVIHLAAQAGIRHGLDHPHDYADTNLLGMVNILEGCRRSAVNHFVFASTSSVYGANGSMPFSEHHSTAHPVSLYGATKIANAAMAHAYAHLYAIPSTGIRFFTVYGPWGRPDMAPIKFTKAILAGESIPVFNNGKHSRDFTYIDDIVEGVLRIAAHPPTRDSAWASDHPDPSSSGVAPYRLFNIGRGEPVSLMDFISILEKTLQQKAKVDLLPLQPGDVKETWCDVTELKDAVGYSPKVSLTEGIAAFTNWYHDYYGRLPKASGD